MLGVWLIYLNPPLRLYPDPPCERGKCAEYPWKQSGGERRGHHIPQVQAKECGAIQPGEEGLAWAQSWSPPSDAFSKAKHTVVVYLIPAGKNRTRIEGGVGIWGREEIRRQISAKKEQLFNNQGNSKTG